MISFITDINDPLLDYIKDDPVRPEISKEFRVGNNRFVGVLFNETPLAIVCVSLMGHVPKFQSELDEISDSITIAIFYTIWSYFPGAGSELVRKILHKIKQEFPNITRFITLSPKTVMAQNFHFKNGAFLLRENEETINYEYLLERL